MSLSEMIEMGDEGGAEVQERLKMTATTSAAM